MTLPDTSSLVAFIAAALVLLVIPGPGVVYVVTRSLSQGRRDGLISVLGLSVGALAHVIAATAGLSAILLASATAFGIVKTLGAGYLIYLGIRTLLGRGIEGAPEEETRRTSYRVFVDGVVVSVLNPKIAVFFLAFLPQFTDPSRGSVALQILWLGLIYCAMALVTDGTYALLAGSVRQWLGGRVARGPLPRYATGTLYIGLGVGTAFTGRRP